jgi:hypothetical protein
MSLSGDSRAQFCPERIDLFSQLGHASGIAQDHVSRDHTIFPTGLSGDPGLGLGAGVSVTRHQPLDLSFMINLDRDHKIEVLLLTGLDEQWDDMHHDRSGAGSPLELCGPGPNRRVHNSLEIATRERISEDNLGQSRPIESPVAEYLHAKSIDDGS